MFLKRISQDLSYIKIEILRLHAHVSQLYVLVHTFKQLKVYKHVRAL